MKLKMTFSLTLTLSLLLSLVSLPAIAQAAPPQRFEFNSGVVTPGMGQVLRITISPSTIPNGNASLIRARIRWMQYASQYSSTNPPVCRHMVVSQGATPVETLAADDALSFDVQGTGGGGVQVVVESDSRNVQVNAMIIDAAGGVVTTFRLDDVSVNAPTS